MIQLLVTLKPLLLTILGILAFFSGKAVIYVIPPHDKGKEFKAKEIAVTMSIFLAIMATIILISFFVK